MASSGRESQEQPGSCTETAGQRGCGRTRRYCSCLTAILSRCMYVLSLCGSSPAGPPGDAHTNIKSASLKAFIYHLVGSYQKYKMLQKSIVYCKKVTLTSLGHAAAREFRLRSQETTLDAIGNVIRCSVHAAPGGLGSRLRQTKLDAIAT